MNKMEHAIDIKLKKDIPKPVSALIHLDTGEDIKIRDIVEVVDTSVATNFIYRYTYYDEEGMHTLMKSYSINNSRIVYIKADLADEDY